MQSNSKSFLSKNSWSAIPKVLRLPDLNENIPIVSYPENKNFIYREDKPVQTEKIEPLMHINAYIPEKSNHLIDVDQYMESKYQTA